MSDHARGGTKASFAPTVKAPPRARVLGSANGPVVSLIWTFWRILPDGFARVA